MSSAIERLRNRITLTGLPFTERGSRLLLFREGGDLFIRLSERWAKWESKVGHYRKRPPFIDDLRLLDADGAPLTFEQETYPHLVQIHSAAGTFDWVFLDTETLLIRLPTGRFGLEFDVHAERATTDWRGGTTKGVRRCAYTTNATIHENTISETTNENVYHVRLGLEAQSGDALLLNITPRLGYNRSIPNPDKAIEAARARWEAWFSAAPPVKDELRTQYEYAWWVMRAGLMTSRYYFTREALAPSKVHYVGVWHWDQFFHAIAYRHLDTRLAEDQIRIVLDHQREDGMLPDAIHDEGLVTHLQLPVDEDVTKPPLGAWAALKVYEKSGEVDFLKEVYEPLTHWHRWWVESNNDGDGLSEYRHPFSSGLDDSPLWDHGMPVTAPDLNTYLCLQLESLAQMADLIGRPQEAAVHRANAERLAKQMIARLWDEQKGIFVALQRGKPVPVLSLFNLLPLWTGCLPETMVKRLVANLTDPRMFWCNHPLPTVALSDPSFDPMQMWRGPTWINSNALFIEALTRIGRHDLAAQLRRKTLDVMLLHDDIYEYYHPITGERPPKAAPMFGWSSALFIDLALQETAAQQ